MKKLFLLPLIMFALIGCGQEKESIYSGSGEQAAQTTSQNIKGGITLSLDNFSTYVAINSTIVVLSESSSSRAYYSYFIGADDCRFYDCSVTYEYKNTSGEASSGAITVPLSLSGDGQTNVFTARNGLYEIKIVSAAGTVKIL